MRTLAIGDIHGCAIALDALLDQVQLQPNDLLITLGDYVDRGPHSRQVLDTMLRLHATGQLIALRGNHDLMMLHARDWQEAGSTWLYLGGRSTLESYGGTGKSEADLQLIPDAHWNFLDKVCINYYETATHLFAHACVRPDWPMADQLLEHLLWEKLDGPVAHCSGKVLICGHTKQPSGTPLSYGSTICIDTGAYSAGGWLTCLDVLEGTYWQANEKGVTRAGRLAEEVTL